MVFRPAFLERLVQAIKEVEILEPGDFKYEYGGDDEEEAPVNEEIEDEYTSLVTPDDEILSVDDDESRPYLLVTYRPNEEYGFNIALDEDDLAVSYSCNFQPASVLESGYEEVYEDDNLLPLFRRWLGYVVDEIKAQPALRELQIQQQMIDELAERIDEHISDRDSHFSLEERDWFLAELERIESDLGQRITASNLAQAETEAKLAEMTRAFDHLREQSLVLSKANFLYALAARVAKYAADPITRLTFAGAKKLLETAASHLDDDD